MQFLLELFNTSQPEIFKVRAVPVQVEGGQRGLDDVRILYTRHAHVPFQSVGLCRLRQVGGADIGSVHTGITHKDVSLGMETFDVGLIRNTNFRVRKHRKLLYGFGFSSSTISCGNNAQTGTFPLTEFLQIIKQQSHPGEFQERNNEINLVGTDDFPSDFLAQ